MPSPRSAAKFGFTPATDSRYTLLAPIATSSVIVPVRYVPPPALVSRICVTCEPVGILAWVSGEPISGAEPSNGIIVLPEAIASCDVSAPLEPLLETANSGCPILAPV